jgi:hypothetical protein
MPLKEFYHRSVAFKKIAKFLKAFDGLKKNFKD